MHIYVTLSDLSAQSLREGQPINNPKVFFGRAGIHCQALATDPGLARNDDRNTEAGQFNAGLGAIDNNRIALKHDSIGADLALRRDDKDIRGQLRKCLLNFVQQGLPGGNIAPDFRRVYPDDQLHSGRSGNIELCAESSQACWRMHWRDNAIAHPR